MEIWLLIKAHRKTQWAPTTPKFIKPQRYFSTVQ
ncbi:hypothetical protein HCH_02490 [Hahella chejuensis KCTC 2396]|uniref:Uncharacterized protein n=1 Tax=Hahella chejuensis (strain KCTC 2396) TaxID=349521 RepID=Q2SJ81_HAHCH|nr:hypothetical protein HCH_02490 [Hahella chejuensis KCTC 2396]